MAPTPPEGIDHGDHTTLVEVVNYYAEAGYRSNFFATDEGRVRCGHCRRTIDPWHFALESLRRLEGTSDPDDTVAVVAVHCPACGAAGTLVLQYGPMAPEGQALVLKGMDDQRNTPSDLPAAMAPGEDEPLAPEGGDARASF
jgi:hypothetical protein